MTRAWYCEKLFQQSLSFRCMLSRYASTASSSGQAFCAGRPYRLHPGLTHERPCCLECLRGQREVGAEGVQFLDRVREQLFHYADGRLDAAPWIAPAEVA